MKVTLIEKAAEIVGDNQLLVNIVSKRVQQLNHGSDPYVPTTPEMQSGDIALTEIIEGKIIWHEMTPEELAASRAEEAAAADPFEDLAQKAAEMPEGAEDDRVITITPDFS
ncbi:MAG: DNA-directed RNA polymerase subunit omega [Akkermansia sp.]|nr:DNA-directed RNA polymerase subunit omega [Akkermansia sp.]